MGFDFAGLADRIVSGITGFIQGGGFGRFCEAATSIISGLATGIGQMLPQLIPALVELVIYITTTLIQQLPQLTIAAGQLIVGLAQGIINALPVIWDALCGLDDYFGQLPGRIWTWLSSAFTKIGEWGTSIVEWIATNVPLWIESIGEWFAQLPGKIWTWLVNTVTKIIQWGGSMQQNASTAIQNMISSIISFMQQLPGKIWTWLVNTANRLNAWRQDLISKGTAAAQGLFNAVVNGIKALPEKMLSIGKDIVTGIWNGISSGWNWLIGKVKDLANSLLQGAKDALGIGSPSKAFRDEFGRWLLPGAEIGIEKTMPGALKTMRESATALLEEMRGTVADYSGEIALSAGSLQGRKAIAVGGTSIYYDNRIDQTNNYHEAVPTPSAVAKNQREAIRNIVGGVK